MHFLYILSQFLFLFPNKSKAVHLKSDKEKQAQRVTRLSDTVVPRRGWINYVPSVYKFISPN